MQRQSFLAVVVLLAGLLLSSGTASAKRHKVDVCHHAGDGGHHLVSISHRAVDAHLRHGDALPGDPVPGLPGHEFGDDCTVQQIDTDGDGFGVLEDCDDTNPDVHPGAEEIADGLDNDCDGQVDEGLGPDYLAVAYINFSGTPGFDPSAGDVLIAAVEDVDGDGTPTPGDRVVMFAFPLNFAGSGFAPFAKTEHTVTGAATPPNYVEIYTTEGAIHVFGDEPAGCDGYGEFGIATTLLLDGCSGTDRILTSIISPSLPGVPLNLARADNGQDDPFIDVDIFLP